MQLLRQELLQVQELRVQWLQLLLWLRQLLLLLLLVFVFVSLLQGLHRFEVWFWSARFWLVLCGCIWLPSEKPMPRRVGVQVWLTLCPRSWREVSPR